ncbi:hypothetical protein OSB04_015570 [Centaurea solstitialis]|uniref:Uncharacterized protein n=1 Tax=Centaurea solstitialis TaxID=347529 RepID=A0AA38WGN8_9ASTR|nr:hypothetical protein OSB04_015570 [Centaurea solstitialis]
MEDPKMEARPSPEGSCSDDRDKRKMKEVAKSILKHAGNSARSVKHVITRKGSRIRCDADMAVESDSSFEGSIPSSVSEDVSGPMDSVGTGDDVDENGR